MLGEEHDQGATALLPCHSILYRNYKPQVLDYLAVRGGESIERVDLSNAGARSNSRNADVDPQVTVRTIMAREYARADVAYPAVWSEMRSTSLNSQNGTTSSACMGTWLIFAARERFYGPKSAMYLDKTASATERSVIAEVGDIVHVYLVQMLSLNELLVRCVSIESDAASGPILLRGNISHTWNVHHKTRHGEESFKEHYSYEPPVRELAIGKLLRFLAYAVRIIGLTPPGISSSVVLNCLIPDIFEGLTDGIVDYDAEGIYGAFSWTLSAALARLLR